jgi:hypothetical protein
VSSLFKREGTCISPATVIPYSTVKEACGNFSDDHLLGSGGFGDVYGCDLIILQRKRSYAVKKMHKSIHQGHSEFLKEVEVLTCCSHPNVVPLVAVSMDPEEPCLIFPFNGGRKSAYEDQSKRQTFELAEKIHDWN